MAISKCISLSAENRIDKASDVVFHVDETGFHGTPEFPVAVYLDDVSRDYVNWHWHKEFEIGFVTEGSVVLGCGTRKYSLECGDIFFVNSDVLHSMYNHDPGHPAVFKSIAFHSSIISDSISSVFYTKYLLPLLVSSNFRECILTKTDAFYQDMLPILSEIWDLVYSETPDYEIDVRNGLSTLCRYLNRLQQSAAEPLSSKLPNYLSEKRVQILLDYLHTHYKDRISIQDLAKAASISKTEVLRSFKLVMGSSPIAYLNSIRLQNAAHLLLSTTSSIQEIAADCGFDDSSYFSKLFRKKYQMTPFEYRRQST